MWGRVFLLALAVVWLAQGELQLFSVYYDPTSQACSVKPGKDQYDAVAYCEYNDTRGENGWTLLNLYSNKEYSDSIQMYASGFLEGYVTAVPIWQNWYNTLANTWNGSNAPAPILNWLNENIQYVDASVTANPSDPFWIHAGLVMRQVQGITDGYNAATTDAAKALTLLDFYVLNSDGDLETLALWYPSPSPQLHSNPMSKLEGMDEMLSPEQYQRHVFGDHCSSLIRLTPDFSELYAGHSTWSSYYEMVRVYKQYVILLNSPYLKATTISMSSYPGFVSSVDDFYTTVPSQLAVIETTNGILNMTLLKRLTPNSVLSWMRVMVANRIADSSPQWVDVFSTHNSGTYNNQWIVVDYKLFTPFQSVPDNVLWVAEQIPGYIHSADVSSYLRLGYWPSYNVPFFEDIFNISGFTQYVQQYGNWFSYDLAPRAQIFRRDAGKVVSLQDFMNIQRYNDYEVDPLAYGSPGNAISSRFDLANANDPNPFLRVGAFGAIDSKVTSFALMSQGGVSYAQSGPTHDQQPFFDWAKFPNVSILGLPQVWDFDWVSYPSGQPVTTTKGL